MTRALPRSLAPFLAAPLADPGPRVALPGTWTFWADRSVAPYAPLGPVQPVAFSYSTELSGFGQGSAVLDVDAKSLAREDLIALWAWRLWAYYDGVPVWCGCPTGIVDDAGATVAMTFTELTGYLTQRQFDATRDYRQIEQTTIAREIAGPVADVGVTISLDPGPGFKRDRAYEYLEGEHRGELLTNLSQVLSGPEFRADYSINPTTGRPTCALRIAYPRVGNNRSGLGLSVPGAVKYQGTWDADEYRTRTFAVGVLPENAPDGAKAPVVVVDKPQAGLPRLDRADDWEGVTLLTTLRERANTNSTIYATPALAVTGSTFVTTPKLGTYGLGDDVTVRVLDPLLPGGLTTAGRLTAMAVDAASGEVTWTVAVTSPPAKPRRSLNARLSQLGASTRNQFRHNLEEVT